MNPPPTTSTGAFEGWAQVVGHDAARHWLEPLVRADRLPHALLIVGPPGVGKRTVAEAMIQQHFCVERDGCGKCDACGAYRRDNLAGLQRISVPEDKSVLSIDQVKEMIRVMSLGVPGERGRITLVRQADRMTPEAQDALLKTLEEPPRHNLMILTSDRNDRLLPTIRSRCQRLALAPLGDLQMEEVARRLGLEPELPVSLALGCPGRLAWLAEEGVRELRDELVDILASRPGASDLARFTVALRRGLPAKANTAQVRDRARQTWTLLASLARDLTCLSANSDPSIVRNGDRLEALTGIAGQPLWRDPAAVFERLAQARARIDGYVDPAAALAGTRLPPEDDLSVFGELIQE